MIEKLACKSGRNDETLNIELAILLCNKEDNIGIKEIVDGLNNKDKAIANDCIKVVYEIGERKPELIANYAKDFISLLHSKNNRLAWGSMTALSTIADLTPKVLLENIETIQSAYQNGSVITIDNSITVFAKLCNTNKGSSDKMLSILLYHFETCRAKEIPQHIERASICFTNENKDAFIKILENRKDELSLSQLTRVNKILKKLQSL